MKKTIAVLALSVCVATLGGCTSFDRTTFNTLAVSNSVLKTAQADYTSGKLPQTACVNALITKGKTAQGIAEVAFLDYYQVEQAKGDIAATQAALVVDLTSIAPIIASIQTLYSNPTCGA